MKNIAEIVEDIVEMVGDMVGIVEEYIVQILEDIEKRTRRYG